jgi:hypothetical protein
MMQANADTLRAIYDAFNARDIPLLATLFADDCTTVDVGSGRSYHGFAGFMEWVKPFADAMPDSTATPGLIVADAEWVPTEHVGRGTHTGQLHVRRRRAAFVGSDDRDPLRRILPPRGRQGRRVPRLLAQRLRVPPDEPPDAVIPVATSCLCLAIVAGVAMGPQTAQAAIPLNLCVPAPDATGILRAVPSGLPRFEDLPAPNTPG